MDKPVNVESQKLCWEEKKNICEEWKSSGKSRSQFCKDHGLGLSTFHAWCAKLWPKTKNKNVNLSPVVIVNKKPIKQKEAFPEQTMVEVKLSCEAIIRFELPIKQLATLIQEISYANTIIR